jgi:hypothetical protein
MSELLRLQFEFTRNFALLLIYADRMGYQISLGEAWRPPETAQLYASQGRGISNSLHKDRLAVDINLFRDGIYLRDVDAYKPLGDFWKELSPLNAWGGDFKDGQGFPKPDAVHFSMAYQGRK